MNIDLVYYFREVNHNYFLNGPEKVNGNIVNNSPAYQLSSANDVVTKINQMIASLDPEITNVGLVTSELYTGDIQVNTYCGELNVSSVPDYTQILTNINTNLTNLVSQFNSNGNNNSCTFRGYIRQIVMSIIGNVADSDLVASNFFRGSSISRKLNWEEVTSSNNSGTSTLNSILSNISSRLQNVYNMLRLSVSPNSSITDVISSLNTNIHNDLTEINTTTNNKDTVLIVDGQQDFVIRKQNNDDYDS